MSTGRRPVVTVFAAATEGDVRLHVASCDVLRAPMHRGPNGVLVAPDRLTVTYPEVGPVEVELVGRVIDPARLIPAWPGNLRAGFRLPAAEAPWWAEQFIAGHRPEWATEPSHTPRPGDEIAWPATAVPAFS